MNLKKMTIQELKNKKQELEETINSAIRKFELESQITIDDLYLSRKSNTADKEYFSNTADVCYLPDVHIRIEIQ